MDLDGFEGIARATRVKTTRRQAACSSVLVPMNWGDQHSTNP
jgi:hypothetical protein